MRKIIDNPHFLFLPFCIITFLISKFSYGGITINIKDTYFVISNHDLAVLISIFFGIIGLGYWVMTKATRSLSKWLNLIHLVLTIVGILLILILAQLFRESIWEYDFNDNLKWTIYAITFIVIFGQLIFPINVISGLIKKIIND